jgi:hypothetical protein
MVIKDHPILFFKSNHRGRDTEKNTGVLTTKNKAHEEEKNIDFPLCSLCLRGYRLFSLLALFLCVSVVIFFYWIRNRGNTFPYSSAW